MQQRIDKADVLLNEDGTLRQVGFSTSRLISYNKDCVKNKLRIKEWDYYLVSDGHFCLCLTISDLSYAAIASVSVIDLFKNEQITKSSMNFGKNRKVKLALDGQGTSSIQTKNASLEFFVNKEQRTLKGEFKNFYKNSGENNSDLEFDIKIVNDSLDSMNKVTPFKSTKHFYLNQKINAMTAFGSFTYKGKRYVFDSVNTLATYDEGRGVLPYMSKWKWCSMQTKINGKKFAFNIGEFGNNTAATENMIFYDGKAHKLEDVKIYNQRKKFGTDYAGAWTFYSSDGRVELMFEPKLDRHVPFNLGVIAHVPHQVFGHFSGYLTLDDGTTIELSNILGFCEHVVNRW